MWKMFRAAGNEKISSRFSFHDWKDLIYWRRHRNDYFIRTFFFHRRSFSSGAMQKVLSVAREKLTIFVDEKL